MPAKMSAGLHWFTWGSGPLVKMIQKALVVSQAFFKSCVSVVPEFPYVFGEQNQTYSTSPKTSVRGITPGEIFEFCIVVGDF